MDGLDALSTTYLPTVEPARPVSRPPRYTKEFSGDPSASKETPSESMRGPPTCIPAHLLTPHDCHVHQWGSSDSKIFAFQTNRRRVVIFLVSFRTLKHLLDGLEKSEARAASFPCSKFYCWSYVCKPGQSGRTAACWPRFAPFSRIASFLSFYSFGFFSSPHSPLFLMASRTTYVCLFGRTRGYGHDTGS